MLPLSFGADVMSEGDFAQVSCIVRKGDEPLAIAWSFHGSHITDNLGIIVSPIGRRVVVGSQFNINEWSLVLVAQCKSLKINVAATS